MRRMKSSRTNNGTNVVAGTIPSKVVPQPTNSKETAEKPLPPETNPVEDIPDTQAFVNDATSFARAHNTFAVRFLEPWMVEDEAYVILAQAKKDNLKESNP